MLTWSRVHPVLSSAIFGVVAAVLFLLVGRFRFDAANLAFSAILGVLWAISWYRRMKISSRARRRGWLARHD
jgi:hypothetical protein